MAEYGGFEGNAQTLRILTKLEKKEKNEDSDSIAVSNNTDNRYGLNLTYRSLASILKYDEIIDFKRNKKLSKNTFISYFEKVIKEKTVSKFKNELNAEELDKKIKEEIKIANKTIKIENIIKKIKKYGIINNKGYLCESCLFNLEDTKLDKNLEKYKPDIIKALEKWNDEKGLQKGYYESELDIVKNIKKNVIGNENQKEFKTIECQIMDIADDIAYSTYDFEDALKGGFVSILDCIWPKKEVVKYICKKLNKCKELKRKNYEEDEVIDIFRRIFNDPLNLDDFPKAYQYYQGKKIDDLLATLTFFNLAKTFQHDGYERIRLTSSLIAKFTNEINIVSKEITPLMKIQLREDIREEVGVLKHFAYISLISSNLLKIPEYRGYEIVKTIFDALQGSEGYLLLPDDFRELYLKLENENDKKRLICDFIAGMTDRYVLEFYGRLKSENPQSIFKPI